MLNNLIVVISGGAGRIGSAFSRVVVENGGKVIIGDMNSELGNRLVADLGENDALFFEGNLTPRGSIVRKSWLRTTHRSGWPGGTPCNGLRIKVIPLTCS